jgi:hypothetical protein
MYSPRWLFLYPGLALMLGGLAVMLALLSGPVRIGTVTFDVHTLLYAAVAVALGYQSVIFALFTKIFAITEGLLPEDERLNRVFKLVNLESGLLAGVGILLVGLFGTAWSFVSWSRDSFGRQEPSQLLRLVIPSVFAVLLGSQTILSSFFLSVLGLRRR